MELATTAKFDVYDEPSNVDHRWERYVKSSKLYLTTKGINAAQRQRAILLHCAGSNVQDIADNNITDTVTGQPPAATMFGQNVNDKLPSLQPSAPIKINRTLYRQHDARNKQKGKNYHNARKKAQHCSIKVGDQVLIRSEKKGKVALLWRANPFLVRAVK